MCQQIVGDGYIVAPVGQAEDGGRQQRQPVIAHGAAKLARKRAIVLPQPIGASVQPGRPALRLLLAVSGADDVVALPHMSKLLDELLTVAVFVLNAVQIVVICPLRLQLPQVMQVDFVLQFGLREHVSCRAVKVGSDRHLVAREHTLLLAFSALALPNEHI